MRELDEAHDVGHFHVLDHLRREDAVERLVGKRLEIRRAVRLRDVESLFSAQEHHVEVEVDPFRLDPGRAQELEKLTATAPDVEDAARP